MPDCNQTALILGGTGLVGSQCLDMLLASDHYSHVIALTRRPIRRTHTKLKNLVSDFGDLHTIAEAFKADDFYCALGTTIGVAGTKAHFREIDFDIPVAVAKLALREGARRMIHVSSIGANSKSPVFYLRVKGELEAALKELSFESLYILRPASLDGERAQTRLRERVGVNLSRAFSFALIGRWRKYRPILAADVARAMLIAALSGKRGVHVYESDQIQALVDDSLLNQV